MGLTGGAASGKSTVAALLRDLGAVVIDADLLAREVVAPGTPGLEEVVESFGRGILTKDGRLDRPAMGSLAFADEEARRRLEAIVHPRVRARAVVVVDVPVETQIERMVRLRGMTTEEARARVAAQATREQRRAVATCVIDNTGTLEDLRNRVTEVFAELSGRAAPRGAT